MAAIYVVRDGIGELWGENGEAVARQRAAIWRLSAIHACNHSLQLWSDPVWTAAQHVLLGCRLAGTVQPPSLTSPYQDELLQVQHLLFDSEHHMLNSDRS